MKPRPIRLETRTFNDPTVLLIILLAMTIAVSFLVVVGSMLARSTCNEKAPRLFPLDNSHAEYRIEKVLDNYVISYKDEEHEVSGVYVGKSKVDLKKYVGKTVRIEGKFRDRVSNEQCILNSCHFLFGSDRNYAVVVDIDQITRDTKSRKED